MSTRTFELFSPLSQAECVSRLAGAINIPPDGYDHLWNGSGNACIRGNVQADQFTLLLHVPGRNASPYTKLLGTIQPDAEGSTIVGQSVLDPGFRLMQRAAISCAVFIGIPIFLLLRSDYQAGAIHGIADLFDQEHGAQMMGLVMLAMFNATPLMFRQQSRFYSDFLTEFLMQTLDAHPAAQAQ